LIFQKEMKVRNYERIDALIREAHVQRSAYLGTVIGEALGDAWLAVARLGTRLAESLRHRQESPVRIRAQH
jgi:hypothetical protein